MSAHILLNLSNELGKRDKMRGLPSIYIFFATSLIINYTGARMLDSIYHMTNTYIILSLHVMYATLLWTS